MNLSVIIPNYNGSHLLKKNFHSVVNAFKEYKEGEVQLIIPDDASSDDSVEVINNLFSQIKIEHIHGKLVENKDRNKGGFSKNVNRGVSVATGEILILLNSDVSPHKDFLMPLLKHFEDPKVFAVACMDESIEGDKKVLRGRGVGKWERGFLHHSAGKISGVATNTLWVSGGSGAFRKDLWDNLSGLNELFNPFYWEDIDLSYRALKSGYSLIFEPQSVVIHDHSEGAIKKTYKEKKVTSIVYRNQFFFSWMNITDTNLILSHIFWLPFHLLSGFIRRDWAFLSGFLHASLMLPNVLMLRRVYARKFILSDLDIVKTFDQE